MAALNLKPGDLAAYGSVQTERFLLGLYYVSVVVKEQT